MMDGLKSVFYVVFMTFHLFFRFSSVLMNMLIRSFVTPTM